MENVKSEEKNEQDSSKRPIEEVDDDNKNINEMNKKIKSENADIKTESTDHLPDPVTCDIIESCEIEKTDEIRVEKNEDVDKKKVINYV